MVSQTERARGPNYGLNSYGLELYLDRHNRRNARSLFGNTTHDPEAITRYQERQEKRREDKKEKIANRKERRNFWYNVLKEGVTGTAKGLYHALSAGFRGGLQAFDRYIIFKDKELEREQRRLADATAGRLYGKTNAQVQNLLSGAANQAERMRILQYLFTQNQAYQDSYDRRVARMSANHPTSAPAPTVTPTTFAHALTTPAPTAPAIATDGTSDYTIVGDYSNETPTAPTENYDVGIGDMFNSTTSTASTRKPLLSRVYDGVRNAYSRIRGGTNKPAITTSTPMSTTLETIDRNDVIGLDSSLDEEVMHNYDFEKPLDYKPASIDAYDEMVRSDLETTLDSTPTKPIRNRLELEAITEDAMVEDILYDPDPTEELPILEDKSTANEIAYNSPDEQELSAIVIDDNYEIRTAKPRAISTGEDIFLSGSGLETRTEDMLLVGDGRKATSAQTYNADAYDNMARVLQESHVEDTSARNIRSGANPAELFDAYSRSSQNYEIRNKGARNRRRKLVEGKQVRGRRVIEGAPVKIVNNIYINYNPKSAKPKSRKSKRRK